MTLEQDTLFYEKVNGTNDYLLKITYVKNSLESPQPPVKTRSPSVRRAMSDHV